MQEFLKLCTQKKNYYKRKLFLTKIKVRKIRTCVKIVIVILVKFIVEVDF